MTRETNEGRRRFLKNAGITTGIVAVVSGSPIGLRGITNAMAKGTRHRWGMLIDLERCIGCKACAVACKTESDVALGVFRSSVKELDEGSYPNVGRSFLPWMCNHCKNPICVEDCPVEEIDAKFIWPDNAVEKYKKKATYQRPDGLVLIDQERCVACGACVDLCPYQARFLNPAKKTLSPDAVDDHPAEKCDLCISRLDAGVVPACVNTCQANARIVGDLNDPDSEISQIMASKPTDVILPNKGTDPQCRYVSLNQKVFLEGRDTR